MDRQLVRLETAWVGVQELHGISADNPIAVDRAHLPVSAVLEERPTLRVAREPYAKLFGVIRVVFDGADVRKHRGQDRVGEIPPVLDLQEHYTFVRGVVYDANGQVDVGARPETVF